jgi:hypothetical protein
MTEELIGGFSRFPGFLLSYVGASFRLGIPTLQAFENYIAQGFTASPAQFFSAYQFAINAHDAAGYINSQEGNFLPDPTTFPEAITKIRRKYSYTIGYDVINLEGEEETRYLTISSDTAIAKNDLIAAAYNTIQQQYSESYDTLLGDAFLDSAIQSGPMGTLL